MPVLLGSAMCMYCDFETVRNCFKFAESFDTLTLCMNNICPKGRRINKGHITFEEGVE